MYFKIYLKDLRYEDAFLPMDMDMRVIDWFNCIKWIFSTARRCA